MNIKSIIESLNVPCVLKPFGKEINTKEDFEAVKPAIKKLLCEEEYGYIPQKPESFKVESEAEKQDFCAGAAVLTKHTLTANVYGQDTSFVFRSVVPKNADKIPVFIHISFTDAIPNPGQQTEEIVDQGYAVFTINYKDVTSDDNDFENGCAKVLCPDRNDPHAPGKIAMWAWSIMRVIDYIETLGKFDLDNIAVIGHSRLGKTTLLTAAFDERVKFACINNSGASGDALSRGKVGEDITAITKRFPFWFCPNYFKYAGKENELPFDQHFLLSLVAPRHLIIGTAEEDTWADPNSEFLALTLTDDVYKLYGITGLVHGDEIPKAPAKLDEGNCYFHLRHGTHYLSRHDWNNYIKFIEAKKMG